MIMPYKRWTIQCTQNARACLQCGAASDNQTPENKTVTARETPAMIITRNDGPGWREAGAKGWNLRPLAAALGLLALAAAWPGGAMAHAIILSSTPPAGSTVAGPDVEVMLHYNSLIDQGRSRLSLILPDHSQKPLKAIADPSRPAALGSRLEGLAPGAYFLHWQVLAVDGHMTRGNIPFTVGER